MIAESCHVDVLVPVSNGTITSEKKQIQNGITVYYVPVSGKKKTLCKKQLLSSCVDWLKYNAVSIHFAPLTVQCAIASLCKSLHLPMVMHFHGLNVWGDYYQKRDLLHKLFYKYIALKKQLLLQNASAIVGVSNMVCETVRQREKKVPVITVYNGVNQAMFYPIEKAPSDHFKILCVANLIAIKGHKYLIEAVKMLSERGIDLNVTLIGEGSERSVLESMVADLGLQDKIVFTGAVPYRQVAAEMRKADFFIMPSYFEALGCVYLEAMASNVAALGVRGCGIDEIITDKENGYLVDPQNPEQIAERILYAIQNPQHHARIAHNGYKTVTGSFLWEHAAATMEQVYAELLDRREHHA